MLVLGRKLGEEIQIGDEVRITVIRVDGQTVRIGIEAPREVRIQRSEVARKDAAKSRNTRARSAVLSAA